MTESAEEVRITLRLPAPLRDKLANASEMNKRSMNGEIVERLDWTFDRAAAEMQALLNSAEEYKARAKIAVADIRERTAQLRKALDDIDALQKELSSARGEIAALSRKLETPPSEETIRAMAVEMFKLLREVGVEMSLDDPNKDRRG